MQKGSKAKWCLNKAKPEMKVDKSELRKRLTPIQYRVTQEKATERPFSGEYLKLKDNGMYACVVCGVELFSSQTKYDSACGWPAFYDCIDSKKVRLAPDLSHVGSNLLLLAIKPDLVRTEVTCSKCGAHLGHLFDDGPKPTGKRYCINSAALKFKEEQSNNNGSTCEDKEEETNSLPSETTTTPPPPPTTTTITSTITSTKGIALDTSKSLPSSPTTIGTTGVERANKTATSDNRLKFFNGQNKPVEDERKTSKYLIKANTVSSEVQSKTSSSSSSSLSSSSSSLRRPSGPSPSGTNDSTSLANNLQAVKSRLKSVKTVKPVLVNSNNNNGVMHSTLETHL